ncbi:hypothetical protein Glove_156g75 [Diversispora epigaea]|uniref:Uncharacterized protein n=1 Tax=Diversispora epigaea TaxID=1348612 RepID=A0A397IYB7_9GLOM|nr:hypothetical protein Glove_156g75 [Diversispora epigaea]
MNISQLSYSKHCILMYNNREYFINYRPIKNCIEILLSNPEILQHFIFKYENKKHQGEKSYAKQNSGNWWKYTEASIPSSAYPLFENKNGIDYKINNRIIWFFLKISTIIGDWPEACTYSLTYKSASSNFPCHFCLVQKNDLIDTMQDQIILRNHENMMEHFNNNTGHSVSLEPVENYFWNIPIIWFFLKISTIIGDWPEACTYSLTYKSASSNFPCHFCLVQKNNLIDTMQDQIILRNHENMMEHFNNNTGHSVSLEPVENYFWNIPNLNIYAAIVPDRMHHLDLGLYHYQIEFTKGILGRSSIDKMNERIGAIPRYPGLKIFSKGLQLIVRLTANEHRDLIKVMVFVVDGLLNNDLSEVYVKWNEIYILSRLEIFKESDLEKFQIQRKAIIKRRVTEELHKTPTALIYTSKLFEFKLLEASIFFEQQKKNLDLTENMIKGFAKFLESINGYTTETYESLHKSYVKTPYRLSNKKGIEEQIMKTIRRKAIIKRRVTEELHKTPTALIYTSKLFEFKLLEASIFFEQQKKNLDLTENMIKGFAKFLECLDSFFDINIAIAMDDAELFEYQSDNGTCYAQTLLITEVILPNKSPFHLALV